MGTIITWLATIKMYQKSLKFILLWNLLFCLGLSIYTVLYNLYLKEIVTSDAIGKIVGSGYISYAIFSVLGGILSDRIGPRKTLQLGLIFLFCGFCGGAYAQSQFALFFWAIVTGLGQAFTNVMFVPLLTEHSREEERMKLFSLAFGSGTFFLFLGTITGGVIADKLASFFSLTSLHSIRFTILMAAGCLVASAIPLLFIREHIVDKKQSHSSAKRFDKQTYFVIGNYGGVKLLEGFGSGLVLPFINLFLFDRYGLNATMISVVMSIATLATVFTMLVNPVISKKWGEGKALLVYQIVGLPALLLMGVIVSLPLAAVCLLVFRATFYSMMPIQSKLLMERVGSSIKGLTNSIGFMTTTIGTGIGSVVSMQFLTLFGTYFGYLYLFALSAVCIAASVIYFTSIFGQKEQTQLFQGVPEQ